MRPLVLAMLTSLAAAPALAADKGLGPSDADKDGRLTLAEYRAGTLKELAKYDKNGDGRIIRAELPAMAKLPGVRGQVDKLWKTYDVSGDGAVARDEVLTISEKRFHEVDLDKDGAVVQAEIDAARKAARRR